MSVRATISRMEPVITLKSIRFHGRNYKEGDYLNRRIVRMPHSKLTRLIREGVCILAKDLDSETLEKYGWFYNPTAPRMKLSRISKIPKESVKTVKKLINVGKELYNIEINGKIVNDTPLTRTEALELAKKY
jgi:hypothetical protein